MDRNLHLIEQAQKGDENAKEILMKENQGLIWSIVRKFSGRGYELEDLYQIGSIGLLKCIMKFDLSYDVKFSTYAVPMIIGEIKRFLRDDGMIKVSRSLKELGAKARYAEEEFSKKHGRTPTITELSKILGAKSEELIEALEASMGVESLSQVIHQNDGNPIYLIDKLDQCEQNNKELDMVDKIVLKDIIQRLDRRERQIIVLRYFDDKTQSEIAKLMGISQVQVSRIEKRVISAMRDKLGVSV